jgi:hypothetical protein
LFFFFWHLKLSQFPFFVIPHLSFQLWCIPFLLISCSKQTLLIKSLIRL